MSLSRVDTLGNSWAALHDKLEIFREAKAVEKIKEVEELILEKTEGLKKLLEDVKAYINKNGNLPPVTNLPFSSLFNYGFSFIGVKTNQEQANKTKDIVEKTLEKCKLNFLLSKIFIADALHDVKKIYDDLVKENKANGEVGRALKKAFDDYNFPLEETSFKAKMKAYF